MGDYQILTLSAKGTRPGKEVLFLFHYLVFMQPLPSIKENIDRPLDSFCKRKQISTCCATKAYKVKRTHSKKALIKSNFIVADRIEFDIYLFRYFTLLMLFLETFVFKKDAIFVWLPKPPTCHVACVPCSSW